MVYVMLITKKRGDKKSPLFFVINLHSKLFYIIFDIQLNTKGMRSYSFQITREQYNYLLPIFGNVGTKQLHTTTDRKVEKFFFIGTDEQYNDLLNRCAYIK